MWNFDISAAPKGLIEKRTRTVKDKQQEYDFAIEQPIWAASKDGEVIKSQWLAPNGKDGGRWLGFVKGSEPIAWMLYVKPDHPMSTIVRHAPVPPIIEDVGGE